jgi:spore maturation protein CgeB
MGLGKVAESLPLIKKACSLNKLPESLKNIDKIERRAKPPIYGLEMFKALSRAKIGFNIHGDVGGDFAANVRLFEVTGVGSCMVTDWKSNLRDLFEPDTETVTYRSAEECVEKVTWLFHHPEERQQIAERGQRKTLTSHTYRQRAARLHEIILQHM